MIAVVRRGSEPGARSLLAGALRRAGWQVQVWTPEEAEADRGFPVGARTVVFEAPPGTSALLESQAFSETAVLYAHVEGLSGSVGPLTAQGSAPCPTCLTRPVDPAPPDPLLQRWVAASAALEVETLHRGGAGTLFATSLTWSLRDEPGLTSARYGRRPECRVPGCEGV